MKRNGKVNGLFYLVLLGALLLLAACQQTPTPQATPEARAELNTQAVMPGTVVGWGGEGLADIPADLNNVVAIAAGDFHSLALKQDGTVVAWGRSSLGRLDVSADLTNVVAIAAGFAHSLALKQDGTVVAWGDNFYGQSTVPPGLTGVIAIASGNDHSLALKNDGTVVGWGSKTSGQSTVPPGLTDVIAISAGNFQSLALKRDGTVVGWGNNQSGQRNIPAGLSEVIAIAAGGEHNLALKRDGTLVAWGSNSRGELNIPTDLTDIVAIDAGDYHNLVLKRNGTLVAWGRNDDKQSIVPAGLKGVVAMAAGNYHSLALVVPDITPSVITPNVSGTLGNNDWYTNSVTVTWTVTDEESAVSSQTGCEEQTVGTDTVGTTFTCEASSEGGSATQSVTVKRDTTPPVIVLVSRPPANASGWNNTDVTLDWSCREEISGTLDSSPSQTVSSEGANQSATGTCEDLAGNAASNTQSGINIDKTAPALRPVVSPNSVLLRGKATATSGASDALSGLASQSCAAVDTNSVGNKSVSCSATDNAGNSASGSANYQVIYNFRGFFIHVQNAPSLNVMKAGWIVPFSFNLGGNFGRGVMTSTVSVPINCSTLSPQGSASATEQASTVSQTSEQARSSWGLASHNLMTANSSYTLYVYLWKTNTSWKNTCRQFTMTLNDGTQHKANFRFR
jgi:hypothetical protein